MFMNRRGTTGTVCAALLAAGALAGCSGSSAGASGPAAGTAASTGASTPAAQGGLPVVVSFYPLQYALERVGGPHVAVRNLTAPGAEPHDLELTSQDVVAVSDAALVVHLAGFQPAVDEAVRAQAPTTGLDVATDAKLDRTAPDEDGKEVRDPHFWLDPLRLAAVADSLARKLSTLDPAHAADFTANAARLRADLTTLDGELRTGLATCAVRDLVTSHLAFGYLAQRYGMNQIGISGLSPEAEPNARTLAEVTNAVRERKVRTVYYETLVSPDVARTVAAETGAATAVLDPLEGLTEKAGAGSSDYLSVMRENLATLRTGQACT